MAKAKQRTTLAEHRRSIRAAERALIKTRDELRAATKREGLDTAGIFFGTKFVLRTTATQWVREAKDQAFTKTLEIVALLRRVAEDPTPSPFAHLAADRSTSADSAPEARKPFLIVNNTTTTAEAVVDVAPAIIQESTRILKP
jgi:hypothetical protein